MCFNQIYSVMRKWKILDHDDRNTDSQILYVRTCHISNVEPVNHMNIALISW
jgi:hypothetical protein